MDLFTIFARKVLEISLEAAPWFAFGLLIAALLKLWVPERLLVRWLGGKGFGPILRAAFIGTPLPLCSCGVLPRRHRPAPGRGLARGDGLVPRRNARKRRRLDRGELRHARALHDRGPAGRGDLLRVPRRSARRTCPAAPAGRHADRGAGDPVMLRLGGWLRPDEGRSAPAGAVVDAPGNRRRRTHGRSVALDGPRSARRRSHRHLCSPPKPWGGGAAACRPCSPSSSWLYPCTFVPPPPRPSPPP